MEFYQHIKGSLQPGVMTLEQVFAWNIRFQVLVKNQEEYDLLSAYQLMFGREIQIDIFSEWKKLNGPQEITIGDSQFLRAGNVLLPFAFSTFKQDLWAYA